MALMTDVKNKRYLICLFVLLLIQTLSAQKPDIHFDRLTIEDGLSQSSVFSMMQDSRGFLWFGTEDGLNKYNGYTFELYTTGKVLDSTSISDSWINWIAEDQDSIIWIGCSEGGVNRFDPSTETFTHYLHDPNDSTSLGANRVVTILVDRQNNVWIGTDGGGLNRFDRGENTFRRFRQQSGNDYSISHDHILSIYESRQGHLWIGTDGGGLNQFDRKTGQFKTYRFNPFNKNSLSNNHVYTITEDSAGMIWIGTDHGLNRFDPQEQKFTRFYRTIGKQSSLSSDQIRFLFYDNQNRLWIGTYGGGLNLYDREEQRFYRYQNDKADLRSLSDNMVWSILQDHSGLIWIGTNNGANKFGKRKFIHYQHDPNNINSLANNFLWSVFEDRQGFIWIGTNGGGLDRLDPAQNRFTHFRHDPQDSNSLPGNKILSVYQGADEYLWIGTHSHGLVRFNQKSNQFRVWQYIPGATVSLPNNNVWALLVDKSGNLWVGTDEGLCTFDPASDRFNIFEEQSGLIGNRVRAIYEDTDGTIWIGTYGAGIFHYHPGQQQFTNYRNVPSNPNSLSDNRVSSFYRDQSGRLWIGTAKGLNLYEDGKNFTIFMEEEGLPNNVIYAVLGDTLGNLWLSTNKGLSCFDPDKNTFRNFNVNDGLQSNEFNSGAYCRARNGDLYFGGVNGLNRFRPEDVQPSSFIAPVYLTSFKKFDRQVSFEKSLIELDKISLSYQENYFSFEFASLDFTNPQKNRYQYMLEGFDNDWIDSGTRRFASYTNIDGGHYTFKVRGTNSDGMWNPDPAELAIIITPPFWATLWFRLTMIVIFALAFYSFYKTRMSRIRKKQEKLEQLVQEQTEELRSSYKETDDIMDNVEEGLFLLNEEKQIGKRYSRVLESILEDENLVDKKLPELLQDKIPAEVIQATNEYLDLLYGGEHDTDMLSDLNPLRKARFLFEKDPLKQANEKYLDFHFRPLGDDKDNNRQLIVTVNDVTAEIQLAQKLAAAEDHTRKQMEWLLSILHVDPELLKEFMISFEQELGVVQDLLKGQAVGMDYNEILERVYRSIHLIKGNASLLELNVFARLAHEFEDEIANVKKKQHISGNDFVPLVMKQKEIKDVFNEVKMLFERLSKVHKQLRPKRSYENKILVNSLHNLINQLKIDSGKQVHLDSKHFDPDLIPFRYRLAVKDVLIQLIRNAVVHGIESPQERKKKNKAPTGHLLLKTETNDHTFIFSLRDDGRGLRLADLRKKAYALKKWNKAEIDKWNQQQVAGAIYISGITTSEKADMFSGRGVGMDLVKQKVDQLNGKIEVDFAEGQFCEFTVSLPIKE